MPETARLASEHFFKPENLTALREAALPPAPAQAVDDEAIGAAAPARHLRAVARQGNPRSWCWSAATPWPITWCEPAGASPR